MSIQIKVIFNVMKAFVFSMGAMYSGTFNGHGSTFGTMTACQNFGAVLARNTMQGENIIKQRKNPNLITLNRSNRSESASVVGEPVWRQILEADLQNSFNIPEDIPQEIARHQGNEKMIEELPIIKELPFVKIKFFNPHSY